jgi:hypothetical protein
MGARISRRLFGQGSKPRQGIRIARFEGGDGSATARSMAALLRMLMARMCHV